MKSKYGLTARYRDRGAGILPRSEGKAKRVFDHRKDGAMKLASDRGGEGTRLLVLLHGLGATRKCGRPMLAASRWHGPLDRA